MVRKTQGAKGAKELKVSGEPDPEDMEVSARTATGGEPPSSPKRKDSTVSGTPETKRKKDAEKRGTRRESSTTIDDLYHEGEESADPQTVSVEGAPTPNVQIGGGSGSAAPGSNLSHEQFWSPATPGGATTMDDVTAKQTNMLLKKVAEAYEVGNLQIAPEHQAVARDLSALGLKRADAEAVRNKEGTARFFGLPKGYILELERERDTGEAWNLEKDLLTLQATLTRENTYFLIGDGRKPLSAAVELYSFQKERGKYFLHEQVGTKERKQSKQVERFLKEDGVYKIHTECKIHEEGGYRRKPVTWITNSKDIAERLRPVKTMERRPRQMHSILQISAIVGGLKAQMESDGEIDEHVSAVGAGPTPHEKEDHKEEYYEGWFPETEN